MIAKQKKHDKRLWLIVIFVGIVYIGIGMIYPFKASQYGDAPHYVITTQTLLTYHSLDVMKDYQHKDYHSFFPGNIAPDVAKNKQGEYLPAHDIGGPILFLIPFALLGIRGAILVMCTISTLLIAQIYLLLIALNIRKNIAFAVTLACAIGSPFFLYSHLTFVEPIGACITLFIIRKLLQQNLSYLDLMLSGCFLGILPWIHARFFIIMMMSVFVYLYRIYKKQDHRIQCYLAFISPILFFIVIKLLYSLIIWKSFSLTPNLDALPSVRPLQVLPFTGMLGSLFDQEYGLLFNFPLFFFFIPGLFLTLKNRLFSYTALLAVVFTPYILIFTTFTDWKGGYTPPDRYLLVVAPFLIYYVAYFLEHMHAKSMRVLFIFFTLVGFLYTAISIIAISHGYNGGSGINLNILYTQQLFAHMHFAKFLPSVFGRHTLVNFIWAIICIITILACINASVIESFIQKYYLAFIHYLDT